MLLINSLIFIKNKRNITPYRPFVLKNVFGNIIIYMIITIISYIITVFASVNSKTLYLYGILVRLII